ncbi:tropomyosin isoforms c/e isoform X20 [Penaeus japonicus]|uniref:tropomyosin isoforms c/e isoform X20 n=1 Tax=Penaeus japonicus TaxID=27405 RepID=UPI001C710DEA|nr:tropomyosin isoforms c/e isoform X20 [Penaeus japonicus]
MDSTSSSVTAPENHSHSSPIDSVNNNTMQNGIVAPAGDSEETDEVENVNSSVGNRTSVNGGVALGSVGNVTSSSADRDRNVNNDVDAKPDPEDDKELEELAKLRCQSVATEVVAERYKRRCSDYPGFAFGSSIFSSNTMMKFSIIKNELHNIMNVQLKRAEGEVAALNRRIQLLEEDLERSEERLNTATTKLAEASQAADESERARKCLENRANMEDDRVGILEAQLAQAKHIAEEADKKYEELARKSVMLENDLERAEERAEAAEGKIVELEEELRVVGNNLKSLEVSEEKSAQREDKMDTQLRSITQSLREAEARAEFAERSVQKLQKEVDRLEDDLVAEKDKNRLLQADMEATLQDIQNM